MSNVEHYFENILHHGLDYEDKVNTQYLSQEIIDTIQTCAAYVAFSMFGGEEELQAFFKDDNMTNEEAIEIIRAAIAEVEWEYPMDYAAAFDKAIKALEKEEVD